jgi:hypothetical protein
MKKVAEGTTMQVLFTCYQDPVTMFLAVNKLFFKSEIYKQNLCDLKQF